MSGSVFKENVAISSLHQIEWVDADSYCGIRALGVGGAPLRLAALASLLVVVFDLELDERQIRIDEAEFGAYLPYWIEPVLK